MPRETKNQAEQTIEELATIVAMLKKLAAREDNPQAKAASLLQELAEPDHPVQVLVELMGPDSDKDEDPQPVSLFKAVRAATYLMAGMLKERQNPDNPDPCPDKTEALFNILIIGCHAAVTNALDVMQRHHDDPQTPERHKDVLRDVVETLDAGCPFVDPKAVTACVCKVTTPKQDPSRN